MNKNKTKTLISALALILFSFSLPARAQSVCKQQPVADLAQQIAAAYEGKTLGGLDTQKPYLDRVRIVVENSLG
ncbi:MAG: hypothetical protein QOK48_195, partial [Blastocatellia bacterium]|nr:hypothetical protein [Blastocatellia bacterium]